MPSEGMYTQRDPIGLAGGNPTTYGYVFNTLKQIDPFGLNCTNLKSGQTTTISKPSITKKAPTHHIATNKHSKWTPKFEKLFIQMGMDKYKNGKPRKDILNQPINRVDVIGHKGPHPELMHQMVYDRLLLASKQGRTAFENELRLLANEATTVGSVLNNFLTN